jgi:hypothetical protein
MSSSEEDIWVELNSYIAGRQHEAEEWRDAFKHVEEMILEMLKEDYQGDGYGEVELIFKNYKR